MTILRIISIKETCTEGVKNLTFLLFFFKLRFDINMRYGQGNMLKSC